MRLAKDFGMAAVGTVGGLLALTYFAVGATAIGIAGAGVFAVAAAHHFMRKDKGFGYHAMEAIGGVAGAAAFVGLALSGVEPATAGLDIAQNLAMNFL